MAELRSVVRELGALLGVAVGAAVQRREQLQHALRLGAADVAARVGSPDWLAAAEARDAVDSLARVGGLRTGPGGV